MHFGLELIVIVNVYYIDDQKYLCLREGIEIWE